jgi:hypothetical protein
MSWEEARERRKERGVECACRILFWKEQCDREASTPLGLALAGGGGVAKPRGKIDGLAGQAKQMADTQVDRQGQALALPVIGAFGVDADVGGVGPGVAEKWLEEGAVDVGPLTLAAIGPEVP